MLARPALASGQPLRGRDLMKAVVLKGAYDVAVQNAADAAFYAR